MRLFLKRSVLFILFLILVLSPFEFFLRKMDTSYKIKIRQLTASGKDIELLILGNSHAARIDPRPFSLYAFNLAQVNQSLYFDKRVTLQHIDLLKNLKYVLISVDYHSLYFSDEGMRNTWSYYGYGINYKDAMPVLSRISYLAGYNTSFMVKFMTRALGKKYATAKALDLEVEADLSQPFVKGFMPYLSTSDLDGKHIRERAAAFNETVHQSHEKEEIIRDLEGFINDLKKRNITPILITLPCYGPLRDQLDKKVQQQNETDILRITEKYRIPWWDLFAMPLSDDCFLDCDHLNGKGSMIVSDSLNKKLEGLRIPVN